MFQRRRVTIFYKNHFFIKVNVNKKDKENQKREREEKR
jgi:hypothetical protein